MGALARALASLIGEPVALPAEVASRYPELAAVRLRRGGIAVRVAGWCLGQRSVSAITLWRTVFVGADTPLHAELLLHEMRHVHQFQASAAFPLQYLWESLRRGYQANRFEVDARAYAASRVSAVNPTTDLRRGDV
ncbi:MAG: DUF4157 domain-containing protein [Gemmatimonadaceae bacterium]|nr:DUF4157 domain-containing protein [Gemmatimonadaceae bacterium]